MKTENPILKNILTQLQEHNQEIVADKELRVFYSKINLKVINGKEK